MKNKGLILIILSILILSIKYIKDNINKEYHNKIIEEIKDNKIINEDYEYIEIPKYNIKRLVKEGTNKNILDNYYVGKMNIKKDNLTILAGHNINLVFHKIHYLNKDDIIYFNNKKYIVTNYKEIDLNDYSILNKNYNKETLILMTCTNNKNKRYIVISEFG